MNKLFRNRQEKGITLIALVVTIIILLILAGIAISVLAGENGILTNAKEAKERDQEARKEEKAKLDDYNSKIQKYVDDIVGSGNGVKEENEYGFYFGMPYEGKADFFGNGNEFDISYVFREDGTMIVVFEDVFLSPVGFEKISDYYTWQYNNNKIIVNYSFFGNDYNYEFDIIENGKKLKTIIDEDDVVYDVNIDRNVELHGVYYNEKYNVVTEGQFYKYMIFNQDDNSVHLMSEEGEEVYDQEHVSFYGKSMVQLVRDDGYMALFYVSVDGTRLINETWNGIVELVKE